LFFFLVIHSQPNPIPVALAVEDEPEPVTKKNLVVHSPPKTPSKLFIPPPRDMIQNSGKQFPTSAKHVGISAHSTPLHNAAPCAPFTPMYTPISGSQGKSLYATERRKNQIALRPVSESSTPSVPSSGAIYSSRCAEEEDSASEEQHSDWNFKRRAAKSAQASELSQSNSNNPQSSEYSGDCSAMNHTEESSTRIAPKEGNNSRSILCFKKPQHIVIKTPTGSQRVQLSPEPFISGERSGLGEKRGSGSSSVLFSSEPDSAKIKTDKRDKVDSFVDSSGQQNSKPLAASTPATFKAPNRRKSTLSNKELLGELHNDSLEIFDSPDLDNKEIMEELEKLDTESESSSSDGDEDDEDKSENKEESTKVNTRKTRSKSTISSESENKVSIAEPGQQVFDQQVSDEEPEIPEISATSRSRNPIKSSKKTRKSVSNVEEIIEAAATTKKQKSPKKKFKTPTKQKTSEPKNSAAKTGSQKSNPKRAEKNTTETVSL